MAKKVLTPEQAEIKAMKKAKRGDNWTKFFALVLAAALAFGVFFLGKSAGEKAAKAAVVAGPAAGGETAAPVDDEVDFGGGEGSGESEPVVDEEGNVMSEDEVKAQAVEIINAETAKAAKGSYDYKRVSDYTPDGQIDVGSATDTLNGIIKGVDENADLNSVVGGFLGIGTKEAKVAGGKLPESGMSQQHLLVGTSITVGDIKQFAKQGDVYMIQLNACKNPQKDGSNALHHATNDFFTHQEVVDGISGAVGSALTVESTDVEYSKIVIKATVVDGKLTQYEISYEFAATLNLKAVVVPITGTGKATNSGVYSNIKY